MMVACTVIVAGGAADSHETHTCVKAIKQQCKNKKRYMQTVAT